MREDNAKMTIPFENGTADFKNVDNCLNAIQHLLLLRGRRFNLYLRLIFSIPALIRHLWKLRTVVFVYWCLLCAVLLRITHGCHTRLTFFTKPKILPKVKERGNSEANPSF
jgi:hypothetical protein